MLNRVIGRIDRTEEMDGLLDPGANPLGTMVSSIDDRISKKPDTARTLKSSAIAQANV